MILLSVIVSTSPGREANLVCCLEMLCRQTFSDFEVIVVSDGSMSGDSNIPSLSTQLRITYNQRTNDCCPSRSRNIGAEIAQGRYLVVIDSDILLNPMALAYYAKWLPQLENSVLYGFYGQMRRSYTPSLWFPERLVHWEDARFPLNTETLELGIEPQIGGDLPRWCWSGNMGLSRTLFMRCNGFNEAFIGWGREDTEFAIRALLQGRQIHFTLDTWAEHQCHTRRDPFHAISLAQAPAKDKCLDALYTQYSLPTYALGFYRSLHPFDALMWAIQTHYQPQSEGVSQ